MTKKLKTFRFDPSLYGEFKNLAKTSGLMVAEALEKFMAACIETGAIMFPESSATFEAEARVFLTWLRKGTYWYSKGNEDEGEYSITGRLLQLLPHVKDSSLRKAIEEELKKR